jgi:hypothetical protein
MSTQALDVAQSIVHGRVMLEKQRYNLIELTAQHKRKSFEAAGFKFVWDKNSGSHQIKIDDIFYAWLSISTNEENEDEDSCFHLASANGVVSDVNRSSQLKYPTSVSPEELIAAVEQVKKMATQLHALIVQLPKSVELNGIAFKLAEESDECVTVYETRDRQQLKIYLIDNEIDFDNFRQSTGINSYPFSCTKNVKSIFDRVKKLMNRYHIKPNIRDIDRVIIGIGDKHDISNYIVKHVTLSLFAPKEKLKPFFDEVEQLARKYSFEITKG